MSKATRTEVHTGTTVASCGHTVKVFGPTRENVFVSEYQAQFERCPTCIATCTYPDDAC